MAIFALITLSSQMNYYYNYKRGEKPTFVRVFQMMSGFVTPYSVGLYKDSDVKRMKKYNKLFKIIKFDNYLISLLIFNIMFIPILINESILYSISYGILNALIQTYILYICVKHLFFQILYFYIICKYLAIKVKNLNESLIEMMKDKRFIRVHEIPTEFDVIYREINEYNTTFWSKFLFIIWIFMGILIVITIHLIIFTSLHIIIKILSFYCIMNVTILVNFLISIACSLNSEANKSYKIFHSLFAIYFNTNPIGRLFRRRNTIKVFYKS